MVSRLILSKAGGLRSNNRFAILEGRLAANGYFVIRTVSPGLRFSGKGVITRSPGVSP